MCLCISKIKSEVKALDVRTVTQTVALKPFTKNANFPQKPSVGASEKIEEEFTVARLYINKMKSEVKTLVTRTGSLEQNCNDNQKKIEKYEKELSEGKLLIQQVCIEIILFFK